MILPIVWLKPAVAEYNDAFDWYSRISGNLALRFASAVDDTLEQIQAGPLRYQQLRRGKRRAGVRHFPYGLFFSIEPDAIVILACFHGKRHPQHWIRR